MDKVRRDAFLYMDPHDNSPKDEFAQCDTCRMFVGAEYFPARDGARCVALGSAERVDPEGSCGAYLIWPRGVASSETMANHAAELKKGVPGSATKQELGYVEREVRCENCTFFNDQKSQCHLYWLLNQKFPSTFDLNIRVDPNGCCNANTGRD